jgi:WD40 repeat protein
MTNRKLAWLLAGIVLCASVAKAGTEKKAAASQATAPEPEMVGEGVISTQDDEFGGSISPDGQTLYFEKSAAPHYLYMICESHLVNGKWSAPEILPFSGQYRDTDPVLSPDGESMFFASDRPVNGKDEHRWIIWRAQKKNGAWGEPSPVPGAVNSEGSSVFASIAGNGNIYFASSRKSGNYDVFRARLINGEYQEAEDLGPNINLPTVTSFESVIAPDESYMLLGSFGREDGLGSSDIFLSFNDNGSWGKPINLGPQVNTPARDYSPRISADGKWLYFTSERGMPYEKRTQAITYQQFRDGMDSIKNGLGNIYRIPLEPLLKAAREKAKL